MVALLIIIAILIVLLFYPFRVAANGAFDEEGWRGVARLHPFLGLRFWAVTLWDSTAPPKKKKTKAAAPKPMKTEAAAKLTPTETWRQINTVLALLLEAGRGLKRLRINVSFLFSLADPAWTGRATGAIYSLLSLVLGDVRRCRWRVAVTPDWVSASLHGALQVDAMINLFDICLAFGRLLPKVIRFRREKRRNLYEQPSH